MALISDEPRSATARAMETTNVIVINKATLEQKMREIKDPAVAAVVRVLITRLKQANKKHLEQFIKKNGFSDNLLGTISETTVGIDDKKREQLKQEIEPLLGKIQTVLDKYT